MRGIDSYESSRKKVALQRGRGGLPRSETEEVRTVVCDYRERNLGKERKKRKEREKKKKKKKKKGKKKKKKEKKKRKKKRKKMGGSHPLPPLSLVAIFTGGCVFFKGGGAGSWFTSRQLRRDSLGRMYTFSQCCWRRKVEASSVICWEKRKVLKRNE